MLRTVEQRGPDNSEKWSSDTDQVFFGHARLAIQDLRAMANQPMKSVTGRQVITYNGEIYNVNEVRKRLQKLGYSFSTKSDTEVLLVAIGHWGIEKSLEIISGMFAFALWDRENKTLHLARDRFGEKPLYYSKVGDRVIFASDLRAFLCIPEFAATIDEVSAFNMLATNNVGANNCILENVKKLTPGTLATITFDKAVFTKRYWKPSFQSDPDPNPNRKKTNTIVPDLRDLFSKVVEDHMISDVPVGVFLSGGIDSSIVASTMQQHCQGKVNSFSIGFADKAFNEANYARDISKRIGTRHTEMELSPQHVILSIEDWSNITDEPFGDSSIIPTFFLSKLAKQSVKVVLSGDGGDEMFAGYRRHRVANMFDEISKKSHLLESFILFLLRQASPSVIELAYKIATLNRFSVPELQTKANRLITFASGRNKAAKCQALVAHGTGIAQQLMPSFNPDKLSVATVTSGLDESQSLLTMVMLHDFLNYLPNDVLYKVDRASMANGLEVRAPFLDKRIFDYSAQLQSHQKIRRGKTKWPLRRLLLHHFPEKYFDRPKSGFAVPISYWLKGDLRDWAESLIDLKKIDSEGLFDAKAVHANWQKFLSGETNNQHEIWNLLMFQMWRSNLGI